jgi:hypothetical protein
MHGPVSLGKAFPGRNEFSLTHFPTPIPYQILLSHPSPLIAATLHWKKGLLQSLDIMDLGIDTLWHLGTGRGNYHSQTWRRGQGEAAHPPLSGYWNRGLKTFRSRVTTVGWGVEPEELGDTWIDSPTPAPCLDVEHRFFGRCKEKPSSH